MPDIRDKILQDHHVLFESIYIAKDGKKIPVEINARFFELKGQPVLFSIVRDITYRKKIEQELRESEEKYRLLFDGGMDPIYVNTIYSDGMPGNIVEVNEVACQRFGYTKEEFLAITPLDVTDPEVLSHVADVKARLLRDHYALFESVWVAKDGTKVPIEINSRYIKLKGKVFYIVLSETCQSEYAAEEEIQSLAKFPTENPNPIMRLSDNNVILYANPASQALLDMWGTKRGDKMPIHWPKSVGRELIRGQNITVEIPVNDKIYEIYFVPVTEMGYKNIYFRDITKKKEVEAELQFQNVLLSTQQEATIDGILVVDENGQIISYNVRFIEMWGIPPDVIETRSDERALKSVLDSL